MNFFSGTYILSQVFMIIMFICLGISYYSQNRKKVLGLNIFAQIFQGLSTLLLKGLTGTVMSLVMIINNIILYIKNEKNKKMTKSESVIIIIMFVFIISLSIISYNGILSLLSVVATIIFLIGIWQENMKIYRIMGIISSFIWILYYIYLKSIFAIILNSILIIATIISYFKKEHNEIHR